MGMFLNYQNIAENYTPNNLCKMFPTKIVSSKLNPIEASKPFEEYNIKGELEGYFWRYGETLNLEFNIDGEIVVESDAIIISGEDVSPTTSTVGEVGQRLYNITTLKSYTCLAAVDGSYLWKEDDEFTYPINGDKSVYLSAESYLQDKTIKITLFNFRLEPIHSVSFAGTPKAVLVIDKSLSEQLVKGVYYCSVEVSNDTTAMVIFEPTDCKLLVK